jgi:hypothetical protein
MKNSQHMPKENGFSPANLLSLLRLVKNRSKSCAPAREEYNKYDLTAAPCF